MKPRFSTNGPQPTGPKQPHGSDLNHPPPPDGEDANYKEQEAHFQMAQVLTRHPHPEYFQTPFFEILALQLTLICEDCGMAGITWNLCYHCGRMVCQTCYTDHHQCLPHHNPKTCPARKLFLRDGLKFVQQLRLSQGLEKLGHLPDLT